MSRPHGSESIGQRLRRLRLERNLSQRELASPGVSYAYISRIEAGSRQPSVKALRRLAAKLEVSPEYLETGRDIDAAEARELRLADAELALRLAEPGAAEDELLTILEESVLAGDTTNTARAQLALGFAAADRGDYATAVRLLESAVGTASPAAVERLDVYTTLGRAYVAAGAPERAVELFDRCLEEVRSGEPVNAAIEVRYATTLSYALTDMGDLGRAEAVLREALESARELSEDPYMRVRLYWSLARLSEMEGKSAAALHHIRRAIALLEATDDTIHLGRAHIGCAVIMTAQGNGEAALTHLEQARELLGKHPTAEDAASLRTESARALASLGRADEAVELAREATELLRDRHPAELGIALWALGEGLTLQHDWDAATAAFTESVELLTDQRRWREATQACQAWGKMLRRAGREAEALDVLEHAAELSLRVAPAASLER